MHVINKTSQNHYAFCIASHELGRNASNGVERRRIANLLVSSREMTTKKYSPKLAYADR